MADVYHLRLYLLEIDLLLPSVPPVRGFPITSEAISRSDAVA